MMPLSPTLLTLDRNESGRDFVVGDIHGYVTKLKAQLEVLGFNGLVDRLICVGDLIDRGPESSEALKLLDEPWFFSVLGNHEHMMINGLKHQSSKHKMTWLAQGGEWIADTSPADWPRWFEQIEKLPIAIQVEGKNGLRYGIVHAGFPAMHWCEFASFNEQELTRCVWGRSQFEQRAQHTIAGIDFVIHGHSIINEGDGALQLGNRIYIEPGVYRGADFIIKEI
jgi:serine/threonine protein phosphatase 1